MVEVSEAMKFLKEGMEATPATPAASDGISARDFLREGMSATPAATTTSDQYTGPLRAFMLGVGAVNDAIPTVLGTPGNLEALYNRHILAPLGIRGDQILPTSHDVKTVTDRMGVTGNPKAIPGKGEYPNLEKYGTAAITGAVSSLPWAMTGASIPGLLLSGGLGDPAGLAAHELFPDSNILPLLAGLAGGFAGGGIGNTIDRMATQRTAKELLGAAEEGAARTKAAVEQGRVDNPLLLDSARQELQGQATSVASSALDAQKSVMAGASATRGTMEEKANALKSAVDSHIEEEKIKALAASEAKVQSSLAGADKTFEDVAAAHGTARSEVDAGKAMQTAVRDWLGDGEVVGTSFPKQIVKQRKLQDAAVPGNTPAPLNPFLDTLKNITSEGGNLDAAEKLLRPHLPEQLKSVFDNLLESPGMLKGKPAITETSPMVDSYGNPITKVVSPEVPAKPVIWNDTKKLVTSLGDARGDYKIVNDLGKENVNRLYAALQDSRRMAAADVGAEDIFDSTNAEMNRLYQIAEGPASKVVKGKNKTAQDPNPENVVKALDPTDLEVLRGEMPRAVNQVTAAHLRGDKAWQGLTEQERNVLVPDPAHRAALDSAIAVREGAPEVGKAEITQLEMAAKEATKTNKKLADHSIKMAKKQEKGLVSEAKEKTREEIGGAKADAAEQIRQNNLLLSTDARMREMLASQAQENVDSLRPAATASLDRIHHASLMGLLAGEPLGQYLLQQAGVAASSGLGMAAGAAGGALLPYFLRGITRGPAANPLVGGTAALGNPLMPDISFTAPGRSSQ